MKINDPRRNRTLDSIMFVAENHTYLTSVTKVIFRFTLWKLNCICIAIACCIIVFFLYFIQIKIESHLEVEMWVILEK